MERRDSLRVLAGALLALPTAGWAAGNSEPAGGALVVVARDDSPIAALDALQIHKAYLGLDVAVDGGNLQPLINDTQAPLHEAFLQHVVGSSELNFRRRLLLLTLQHGRPAPLAFESEDALLRTLLSNPYAITYMWLSRVRLLPRLRVVKVLWQQ